MLKRISVLSALVAVCLANVIHAEEVSTTASPKVRELQQQRIEVLEKQLKAVEAFVSGQRGEVPPGLFEMQLEAANGLIDAKLEIAETPDQTIALLKSAVENAEQFRGLLEARSENPVAVLQAEASRLEAELRLVQYQESHIKPAATDRHRQLRLKQIKALENLQAATEAFISGQRGSVSPQLLESVMDIKRRHFEAQLAIEAAPEQQLALHRNYLDETKRFENLLRSRAESAVPIFAANAIRLDAEIRLAQLEAKLGVAN